LGRFGNLRDVWGWYNILLCCVCGVLGVFKVYFAVTWVFPGFAYCVGFLWFLVFAFPWVLFLLGDVGELVNLKVVILVDFLVLRGALFLGIMVFVTSGFVLCVRFSFVCSVRCCCFGL